MSKNNQDNKTQSGLVLPKEWTAAFGPAGLDTATDSGFPSEWTVFGPVGKADPEPDFAGMAAIPEELAIAGKRLTAQPFGMRIQAIDVRPIEPAILDELKPEFLGSPSDIDRVVRESDFVSLHLHLTPETRHTLDARRIGLMKRSACIINVARGALVDEAAMHAALLEGRIAGAGLNCG